MTKINKAEVPTDELVMNKIYLIRGKKVMLDSDLAELYQVETKVLNQAVRRNSERFPDDFMFQLTENEWDALRSQFVTLKNTRGKHSKYRPYVFTEQGVAMLSGVLNSTIAIQVHIQIIRVFARIREMIFSHKDILLQLEKIERKVDKHDEEIILIFNYLKQLLNPPQVPRQRIGFK
jgi:hypothetical protein